eukprot:137613-Hanusia_phi.AAC.3
MKRRFTRLQYNDRTPTFPHPNSTLLRYEHCEIAYLTGLQFQIRIRLIRDTLSLVNQLGNAWSNEKKALNRCKEVEKTLEDALKVSSLLSPSSTDRTWQEVNDPSDELLRAAEKACEEYDRAISATSILREKFLSLSTLV